MYRLHCTAGILAQKVKRGGASALEERQTKQYTRSVTATSKTKISHKAQKS